MRATRLRKRRCSVGPQPLVVLLSLSFVLAGPACREGHGRLRELPADGAELPILDTRSGTHSHESRAMQLAIRDPAALAQVPLVDIPVDFSTEMVLIVTLGRVPSDLYAVNIDRVWRDGRQLRVATTVTMPPAGAPPVVASPYCIAVVPQCDLNVAGFSSTPPQRTRSWEQSAPLDGR
jgi:hypothetical protein